MSTKLDPGRYDCYMKLADDEPYFLLRAKDATAPDVVRHWIKERRAVASANGVYIDADYEAKLQEAEACAVEMERWRREHVR